MNNKNRNKKKVLIIFISIVALLLVSTEVFLRLEFGLGNTLLFQASDKFEYLQLPQQEVKRFGNRSYYNTFSQRNREITSNDSVLVDFFGDSVLNGGVQTDNDSLATSLLSEYWTKKTGKNILALNISAGSWGPDNAYGYLQSYGDFGAKKIVLVVSSHDAYDNMDFKAIVGIHPSYPNKQPLCALTEFISRYLPRYLPKFMKKEKTETDELLINKKDGNQTPFNSGFENFYNYCNSHNIELSLYLHADKDEWKAGEYNEQGQEIIDFCNERNLKIIKELDFNFPEKAYRDGIHLSQFGQFKMFNALKDTLDVN
ncbi:MAG: hypothetical protein LBV75_06360 [Paludibacter sp.]|jgi:lysophospholipase L1-like esterase|nr:hypothetical protein [Paludibacter sp.]